ncbi:YtzI protein [Tenuibacillus multivorans]|uniref:Tumour necrosis factor receptor superfamily member 19 n=1 Tax=Tenuibacillus multivorans TaxID=237069 RepID=A0A1H0B6D6_9BACI|nr:YtzI protein [Tenuibacillus multivorans]GEL78626.1 hypothetical protein TMU01_28610 [Tenuibacillus multivorans]SDN41194.1 Tumour necrosis factor receptor superfamily member 19 [Tenuibacillus multivorans]
MLKVLILSIVIIIAVLALSVFAISKGYAYEHKIDPLPDDSKLDDKEEKNS